MTEQHSPTKGSAHRPSLADAETVQVVTNGHTYTKNKRTGEYWYSMCSAHLDFTPDCDMCTVGGWAHPIDFVVSED